MDLSQCRYFGDLAIIGSSHAVRFGNKHGKGGQLTEGGRRAGLALSGQTITGLTEEVRKISKHPSGALIFIGANDVKSLALEILNGNITLKTAQDKLKAAMKNLVRVLPKVFSGKIVFCETVSCQWKRMNEDWRSAATSMEYAVCRVPRKVKEIEFVPVNHRLTSEHYEKFIGQSRSRDYIHLNKKGYAVVAEELSSYR